MNKQSILRVFIAFAASVLFAGAVNASGVDAGPAASIFLNQPDGNDNYLDVILAGAERKKQGSPLSNIGVGGNTAHDYLATLSGGHTPQGSFLTGANLATEVQQNLKNEIARERSRFGGSAAIPIPAAVWLLGSGLSFLFFFGRRNAKARS